MSIISTTVTDDSLVDDWIKYSIEASGQYGAIDNMLRWCRANVSGRWEWTLVVASSRSQEGLYRFYFDSESDALAFSLRWA